MIVLISPAKKQNFSTEWKVKPSTSPLLFPEKTHKLVQSIRQFSTQELKSILKVSADLATINHNRFHNFPANIETPESAVLAYQGDVYRYMNRESWNQEDMRRASERLVIISGLYGCLRADTGIAPYRLEMANKLPFIDKSLQDFWKEDITQYINKMAEENNHQFILNLASKEYSQAIDRNNIDIPVIDIDFLEPGINGKLRTVAVSAKRARGDLTGMCMREHELTIELIKKMVPLGYRYNDNLSAKDALAFVKEAT